MPSVIIKKNIKLSFFYTAKIIDKKAGFSLIESLVVVSLFGLIAFSAIGALRETRNRSELRNVYESVLQEIKQARSRAAAGVGNTNHGVYVKEKSIVIFEGDNYAEGEGEEIFLPSSILTNQSGISILFYRLSAEANATSTIVLTNKNGESLAMTISSGGMIQ